MGANTLVAQIPLLAQGSRVLKVQLGQKIFLWLSQTSYHSHFLKQHHLKLCPPCLPPWFTLKPWWTDMKPSEQFLLPFLQNSRVLVVMRDWTWVLYQPGLCLWWREAVSLQGKLLRGRWWVFRSELWGVDTGEEFLMTLHLLLSICLLKSSVSPKIVLLPGVSHSSLITLELEAQASSFPPFLSMLVMPAPHSQWTGTEIWMWHFFAVRKQQCLVLWSTLSQGAENEWAATVGFHLQPLQIHINLQILAYCSFPFYLTVSDPALPELL